MSTFSDFSFGSNKSEERKNYVDFTTTAKELVENLRVFLEPYKPIMEKEFLALDNNNKKWKKTHDGEDCEAFIKKQWALSAPFNAMKIIEDLYVNRKSK